MRIVLLISCIMPIASAFGQVDWRKRISISVNDMPLERLLEILEENHGIRFSYGFDNIDSHTRITLNAENKTFLDVIQQICLQSNMTYVIISDAIVFKPYLDKQTKNLKTIASPIQETAPPETDNGQIKYDSSYAKPEIKNPWSTIPLAGFKQVKRVPSKKPSVTSLYAMEGNRSGIFLLAEYDFNQFNFHERPVDNQRYEIVTNQSFGLGVYRVFSKRFYVSLGAVWNRKAFGLNYNYLILDPNDPFPVPSKTIVTMNYLELPLTIGMRVFEAKKNHLWFAVGMNSSTLLNDHETTYYQNTGNPNTRYFIDTNNARFISCSISVIYYRSISRSWGIFIASDANFFSPSLNNEAMDSPKALLRAKSGLQYSF